MKTKTKNNIITAITIVGGFTLYFVTLTLTKETEIGTKIGIAIVIALSGFSLSAVAVCLQNKRVTSLDEKLEEAKSFAGARNTMTSHILKDAKKCPTSTYYTLPEIFHSLMTRYVEENASTGALKNLIETTKFGKDSFLDAIHAAVKHLRVYHLHILLDERKTDINNTFDNDKKTLLHKATLMFPSIKSGQRLAYMNLIEFLIFKKRICRKAITSQPNKQTAADIFKKLSSKEAAFNNEDTKRIAHLLDSDMPLDELRKLYPSESPSEQAAQESEQAAQESTSEKPPGEKGNETHTKP